MLRATSSLTTAGITPELHFASAPVASSSGSTVSVYHRHHPDHRHHLDLGLLRDDLFRRPHHDLHRRARLLRNRYPRVLPLATCCGINLLFSCRCELSLLACCIVAMICSLLSIQFQLLQALFLSCRTHRGELKRSPARSLEPRDIRFPMRFPARSQNEIGQSRMYALATARSDSSQLRLLISRGINQDTSTRWSAEATLRRLPESYENPEPTHPWMPALAGYIKA